MARSCGPQHNYKRFACPPYYGRLDISPKKAENNQPEFDHNVDRYPDLDRALAWAMQHEDFPHGPVERLEVTCLASNEATWRVWPARAEEPIGGHVAFD